MTKILVHLYSDSAGYYDKASAHHKTLCGKQIPDVRLLWEPDDIFPTERLCHMCEKHLPLRTLAETTL